MILEHSKKVRVYGTITLAVMLVVPFCVGFVDYGFLNGIFRVQPGNYLLGCVGLVAACGIIWRPKIGVGSVILVCLELVRLVDCYLRPLNTLFDTTSTSLVGGAMMFCLSCAALCNSRESLSLLIRVVAPLTISICCIFNILDIRSPGLYSPISGRAAGMLGNPNQAAGVVCSMLGVFLATRPKLYFALGVVGVAGVAILLTLSRGGMAIFVLEMIAFVFYAYGVRQAKNLTWGILGLAAVVFAISASIGDMDVQGADARGRSGILRGESDLDLNDTERIDRFNEGLDALVRSPLIGYGSMACANYQPHNEFIGVWLDNGVLGVGIFILGLVLMHRSFCGNARVVRVAMVPLVMECIWSHNLLEDKAYLFCWVAASALAKFGIDFQENEQHANVRSPWNLPIKLLKRNPNP